MHFRSGRFLRVNIEQGGISVSLETVPVDFNRTRGLCGNFDGVRANDVDRPAWFSNDPSVQWTVRDFVKSWRCTSCPFVYECSL